MAALAVCAEIIELPRIDSVPSMSDYLDSHPTVIRARFGSECRHLSSFFVSERCSDSRWIGDVETWLLITHPQTQYCYTWRGSDGGIVAVLQIPPVISPTTAVRIYLQQHTPDTSAFSAGCRL